MTGRYDHAATAERAKPLAEWRRQALCNGRADLFDTPPGHGRKTPAEQAAIALCHQCPVLRQCHADVMRLTDAEDPGGICAGLTEKERTKLRRKTQPHKRCADCQESKPREDFRVAKNGTRTARCGDCLDALQTEREALRQANQGSKKCANCEQTKPKADFPLDRSRPDGVHAYCLDCRRETWRGYNARRRLGGAESPPDGLGTADPTSVADQNDSENDFAATNYEINLRDFEIDRNGLTPAENMKQTPESHITKESVTADAVLR